MPNAQMPFVLEVMCQRHGYARLARRMGDEISMSTMNSVFRRLVVLVDKGLSVVIWLHNSIMLFVCLFGLLPLIALFVFSALFFDLRHLLRGKNEQIFLSGLVALPPWLAVCLYAELANTPAADRMRVWMGRIPVYTGCALFGVGAALWLLGVK